MSGGETNAKQVGFSLLEIVVALAVLTFGITSAFALFAAATAAHKRAIDRTHAASIAEHTLADVESALARGVSPEEILAQPPIEEIQKNWPGYDVAIEFFGIAGATAEDEILVRVIVFWSYRGQERQEVYEQLVVRSAIIGEGSGR